MLPRAFFFLWASSTSISAPVQVHFANKIEDFGDGFVQFGRNELADFDVKKKESRHGFSLDYWDAMLFRRLDDSLRELFGPFGDQLGGDHCLPIIF
jgi:hypothetical protein